MGRPSGEAQVYGPRSEARKIDPDGGRGETGVGTEGHEPEGIRGGDRERVELELAAEDAVSPHCGSVGCAGVGGDAPAHQGRDSPVKI